MPTRKRSSGSTDLPSTLERSSGKAQETWLATHDAAVEQYGEGERAHRTAFASLKHSFEKVGDHWEEKAEKGPSDRQAERRGAEARAHRDDGDTAGGVDANASKRHLYDIAKRLEEYRKELREKVEDRKVRDKLRAQATGIRKLRL